MITSAGTTNGPTLDDVDSAVRTVIAEMFGRRSGKPKVDEWSEDFSGRLFALRHAETLKVGVRAVRVSPGTVVTPLARDYLKRQGIEVRYASRSELERVDRRGEWAVAFEDDSGLNQALRRSLLDGEDSWREIEASPGNPAMWVAETSGRGALVLTREASVAVFRACLVPGVRACSAAEPEAVSRAVKALGVNLLVVETPGKPIALVRQIGAAFRRGGGPELPACWPEGRGTVR